MELRPDLHLLGVSFRTAAEEVREGLAFSRTQVADLLAQAKGTLPGVESVVLSTCNRTEFYLSGPAGADVVTSWHELLQQVRPGAPALDRSCARYVRHGEDAFRHLVRVACGLDSALLGDGQVLGQVRRAVALSQGAGALGAVLSPAFAAALRAGRRARAETDIGAGAPGLGPAVAQALSERAVHPGTEVLVLGSGEAARVITRSLRKAGHQALSVSARNAAAAAAVAAEVGASTVPWSGQRSAEVVVAATGASEPVVVQPPPGARLVIDAGFPRQVAPAVAASGVAVVSLLELTQQADAADSKRRCAVPQVLALVDEQVAAWQAARDRAPLEEAIKRLHVEVAEMTRATAAELAVRTGAPPGDLERLIGRQVRRVLHGHVDGLRALQTARP